MLDWKESMGVQFDVSGGVFRDSILSWDLVVGDGYVEWLEG